MNNELEDHWGVIGGFISKLKEKILSSQYELFLWKGDGTMANNLLILVGCH